ncbi:MAG: hypothetical protein Rubg2KO_16550 [Rubricoccaceae bacterium]
MGENVVALLAIVIAAVSLALQAATARRQARLTLLDKRLGFVVELMGLIRKATNNTLPILNNLADDRSGKYKQLSKACLEGSDALDKIMGLQPVAFFLFPNDVNGYVVRARTLLMEHVKEAARQVDLLDEGEDLDLRRLAETRTQIVSIVNQAADIFLPYVGREKYVGARQEMWTDELKHTGELRWDPLLRPGESDN